MKKNSKRDIRSFESDQDVSKLLDLAIKSTGKNKTTIINAALREHLHAIVKEFRAEQNAAYSEMVKELNSLKGKQSDKA